ncbi:MAG: antA/AntB antirepressor family protein [Lactococcus lactis]|jgi:anti-repressor protein|nr:antA/AntB antirepressor family protein [Lactococcus lactis]
MNFLEILDDGNGEIAVSARELYEFLQIKSRYDQWFRRMVDYGFIKGRDYINYPLEKVTTQGNRSKYLDHIITVDMAKHIAFIQRSERGMMARNYFIEVERRVRNIVNKSSLEWTRKGHWRETQSGRIWIEPTTVKPKHSENLRDLRDYMNVTPNLGGIS